jgi:hypothetical protein
MFFSAEAIETLNPYMVAEAGMALPGRSCQVVVEA